MFLQNRKNKSNKDLKQDLQVIHRNGLRGNVAVHKAGQAWRRALTGLQEARRTLPEDYLQTLQESLPMGVQTVEE